MIKVFGHQAPDTDATCSAIVWAWYLQEHRDTQATPYVLGALNTEARFVLERWGYQTPELLESVSAEDSVAIVDTNNHAELFENINETNIVSIIDHHKLIGGLETQTPIEIIIQPYASTMTVIFTGMNMQVPQLPENIAGIMLSGILSDTLGFRSPTTTETDKELALELAKHVGVDADAYAMEMFEAKSDTSEFSAQELIRMDSKIFEVDDVKLRVSVLETTLPESVMARKAELVDAMSGVCSEDSVDEVLLFVVDILNEGSTLLTPNERTTEIARLSFDVTPEGDTVELPGIVSRKKQILPALRTK